MTLIKLSVPLLFTGSKVYFLATIFTKCLHNSDHLCSVSHFALCLQKRDQNLNDDGSGKSAQMRPTLCQALSGSNLSRKEKINLFKKKINKKHHPSVKQFLIQIRLGIMSGQILVQTDCKGKTKTFQKIFQELHWRIKQLEV